MTLGQFYTARVYGPIAPVAYHPTVSLTDCLICWHVHRDTQQHCPVCGAMRLTDGRHVSLSSDGTKVRWMASAPGAGRSTFDRLYRLAVESADPDE